MRVRQNQGFSIVEVVVCLAVISIALGASCEFLNHCYTTMLQQKLNFARTRILTNIVHVAGIGASLNNSLMASENSALNNCFNDSGSCPAAVGTLIPFRLYSPIVNVTAGGGQLSTALTGEYSPGKPDLYPVRYDLDGNVCDTVSSTCSPDMFPIQVSTAAFPVCPPLFDSHSSGVVPYFGELFRNGFEMPDNCWAADSVVITVYMQASPGQTGSAIFGLGAEFRPVTTTTYVPNIPSL